VESLHLRLVSLFFPLLGSLRLSPILTLNFPGLTGSIIFLGALATTIGGIFVGEGGGATELVESDCQGRTRTSLVNWYWYRDSGAVKTLESEKTSCGRSVEKSERNPRAGLSEGSR